MLRLCSGCREPARLKKTASKYEPEFTMPIAPNVGRQKIWRSSRWPTRHSSRPEFQLAFWQHLVRVARVTRLHSERRKRVRILQRFRGCEVHRSHPLQQLRNIVGLRKLNLPLNERSLQIFFNCLLAMKCYDFPENGRLAKKVAPLPQNPPWLCRATASLVGGVQPQAAS